MFGYVTINKGELKVKDYEKYRAYYCGLCEALKSRHGLLGQVTLTYDMTFITILLSGLYESEEREGYTRCIVHPLSRHRIITTEFSDYCADMNMLLAYYKLLDDWNDDKDLKALVLSASIKNRCKKAARRYPRQAKAIKNYIIENKACEEANEKDIDKVAGCTGRMLVEILRYEDDMWRASLGQLGFYLGKFIYIMDACDDLSEDLSNGSYNPLKGLCDNPDKDKIIKEMLMMMAAGAASGFEKLPILQNQDILRNILYSGIWARYNGMNDSHDKKGVGCERPI